jgi:hypothetical protein
VSDLIISARIIQHGPSTFLVLVSSAAVNRGDEDSASDLLTVEVDSKARAEDCRHSLVDKAVEAAERRGHKVLKVDRSESLAETVRARPRGKPAA